MVSWIDGGDVVVSGSDALTKPSGSQYSVSGGNGPYTWSVSGTGATVTQDGYLELSGSACGAFTVTCTDCTGRSDSIVGRVTNNGQWVRESEGSCTLEIGDCPTPGCSYCGGWHYGGWNTYDPQSDTYYGKYHLHSYGCYNNIAGYSDWECCLAAWRACIAAEPCATAAAMTGCVTTYRGPWDVGADYFPNKFAADHVPANWYRNEWTC